MKKKNKEQMDQRDIYNIILEKWTTDREFVKELTRVASDKRKYKITITFPGWLAEILKREAQEVGEPINEIVRDAVIDYLLRSEGI